MKWHRTKVSFQIIHQMVFCQDLAPHSCYDAKDIKILDVWFGGYLTTMLSHQKMFSVARYGIMIEFCGSEEIRK
jgi:hypothetical protein